MRRTSLVDENGLATGRNAAFYHHVLQIAKAYTVSQTFIEVST